MIDIPIIFEDNHLLVVRKPPNLLSQGDRTGDLDLLTLLKEDLKMRYNKPGNVYLGLVHRLDRPVGGVMVFAKTSKSAARLSAQIRNGQFKKVYLAVVHGKLIKQKDILIHYLLKDNKINRVSAVKRETPGAKEAVLEYEIMDRVEGLSLVKVDLHTGRSHQIRVQFSAIGHPLFGDQRYGSELNQVGQQIALWSHQIAFEHPTLKKEMSFASFPDQQQPWDRFELD
jgi:23S rRNA pseudouridine1911/1915/1917 synthase